MKTNLYASYTLLVSGVMELELANWKYSSNMKLVFMWSLPLVVGIKYLYSQSKYPSALFISKSIKVCVIHNTYPLGGEDVLISLPLIACFHIYAFQEFEESNPKINLRPVKR